MNKFLEIWNDFNLLIVTYFIIYHQKLWKDLYILPQKHLEFYDFELSLIFPSFLNIYFSPNDCKNNLIKKP